jgi:hypothetical protein
LKFGDEPLVPNRSVDNPVSGHSAARLHDDVPPGWGDFIESIRHGSHLQTGGRSDPASVVVAPRCNAKRRRRRVWFHLERKFRVVDATGPIDEIHADPTRQIMDHLTSRGRAPGMKRPPGGSR